VLAAALDGRGTAPQALPQIVAASREVVGENPFTVIFDRGGYDSKLFTWLNEVGMDFITYQRGEANPAAEGFRRREARFEGRRVRMQTSIGGGGPPHPPADRVTGHLPARRAHRSGTPARASMSRPLNLEGSTSMRNCVYLTAADRRAPT
jgi:hypothetical protein